MHLVHMPLQVPTAWLNNFSHIDDSHRRLMHAMVAYLDNDVGRVVAELKNRGYWENTLVIFHADNGGEILGAGICGGNNWPLRGGKFRWVRFYLVLCLVLLLLCTFLCVRTSLL